LAGAYIDVTRNAHLASLGWLAYALLVIVAAVDLIWRKSLLAALVCASAPLAVLVHFAINGFHAEFGLVDKLLLTGFVLLWLRYVWRTLRIARSYPQLPAAEEPEQ
jgi:hypothetical protein